MEIDRLRTGALVDALHDNRVDVGFVRLPVPSDGLRIEKMMRDPLVVAMTENHPLAAHAKIPMRLLSDQPYVMFARYVHPGYYDLIAQLFQNSNCRWNVVSEQIDSLVVLLMIAAGVGIAILPSAYRQQIGGLRSANVPTG